MVIILCRTLMRVILSVLSTASYTGNSIHHILLSHTSRDVLTRESVVALSPELLQSTLDLDCFLGGRDIYKYSCFGIDVKLDDGHWHWQAAIHTSLQ